MSRSVPHSKLLHKRDSDKVDAQEENFLPKYQRMKDLCQRAEYQTGCEQLGQVRRHPGAPRSGQVSLCPACLPSSCPSKLQLHPRPAPWPFAQPSQRGQCPGDSSSAAKLYGVPLGTISVLLPQ